MMAWLESHHFRRWGWVYIFIFCLLGYRLSNNGHYMAYNYYTYLAQAMLHGSVSIANPPSWFLELAKVGVHNYVRIGIMPAILMMPIVAIWGLATNEAYVSLTLGAVTVALMWLVLGNIVKSQKVRLAATILFGFGTVFWFCAEYGNSWYFAHVVVDFFVLLALLQLFRHRPSGLLIGLFLGCAFLSRYSLILAFPFFAIMLWQKTKSIPQMINLCLYFGILVSLNGFYNYVRFGNFLETGYKMVELQDHILPFDPNKGLFNVSYFPFDAGIYFLKGPDWLGHFPWFAPNKLGMSIFLTTPAVVYALWARLKENLMVALCWLSVVLLMLPSIFYFYVGWTEFGWRYSLDFMPFLIILIALGFREKLDWLKITLISLSVLVNLWGVVWWRIAGW